MEPLTAKKSALINSSRVIGMLCRRNTRFFLFFFLNNYFAFVSVISAVFARLFPFLSLSPIPSIKFKIVPDERAADSLCGGLEECCH